MPKYKKVQFIGYKINTFPTDGNDYRTQKYLGASAADKDICKRCSIMQNAIRVAKLDAHIDRTGSTLKLFMAPEFFFRGNEGAYPIEKIPKIMEKMREYTGKDQFKNWMFVFGTALGYQNLNERGTEKEIFNIALVQKGGVTDNVYEGPKGGKENTSLIIYKEYLSHIDFLRNKKKYADWGIAKDRIVRVGSNEALVVPTLGSRDIGSKGSNNTSEKNLSGIGGGGIFTMFDIIFGVEICLDHYKHRLREAIKGKDADMKGKIQIQLVPSAGAEIVPGSVIVCQKGLVFNVDGGGPATDVGIADYNTGKLIPVHKFEQDLKLKNWDDWLSITHSNYFQSRGSYVVYNPTEIP